jgi:Ca-activated chloride channel family protein
VDVAKRLPGLPVTEALLSRVIILLTDGDNNKGEIDPVPAAQLAAALGAKIYTIGIGIEKPCHLPAFDPTTGKLLLDVNGDIKPTLLLQPANYSVLGKIAEMSRAQFYHATNRRELQNIYNEIDRLEKSEVKLKRYATYQPLFQWPLLAAIAFLTLEAILSNTRYRRVP